MLVVPYSLSVICMHLQMLDIHVTLTFRCPVLPPPYVKSPSPPLPPYIKSRTPSEEPAANPDCADAKDYPACHSVPLDRSHPKPPMDTDMDMNPDGLVQKISNLTTEDSGNGASDFEMVMGDANLATRSPSNRWYHNPWRNGPQSELTAVFEPGKTGTSIDTANLECSIHTGTNKSTRSNTWIPNIGSGQYEYIIVLLILQHHDCSY